jgi:hypothetical protein
MLLVHEDGPAAAATNDTMSISFDPSPTYAAMAAAASGGTGNLATHKVASVADFETALQEAVKTVKARKGAFVEAVLERRK